MNGNDYVRRAREAWLAGARLRDRRLRFKRYTFGDQWCDLVADGNGVLRREDELVKMINHHPATNNIIRPLVKTVTGYYRSRQKEGSATGELDSRTFEEFLISGCAVQRVDRGPGERVTATGVSIPRFFLTPPDDPGENGVELLGQLHDMTLKQAVMRYSHGSRAKAEWIKRVLENDGARELVTGPGRRLGESMNDGIDFDRAPAGLCRVIEVWSLDTRERLRCHDRRTGRFYYAQMQEAAAINAENRRRRKQACEGVDTRWELAAEWRCRMLSVTGEVLEEFTAERHPYVWLFYPMIDGEIHSFVEDIIEQQRNVNRLLTLNDRILSTAAKGVLLFPENQEARMMSIDEAVDNWTSPDGVVVYKAMAGLPGPQQVVATPGNLGIHSMVEQQLRLIEDVSCVGGTLRGNTRDTGTNYYDTRHDSALMALADMFETFKAFTERRDGLMNNS